MNWWQSIILGLVQGLTEFLPVSSSGHLTIFRELLGVEAPTDLVFEVTVHAATVLATIIVFRKQIAGLLRGFFKFKNNDETDYVLKILVSLIPEFSRHNPSRHYVLKILVSLIPVFVVGMFFKDKVEALFTSLYVVGGALIVTSILLYFSDVMAGNPCRKTKDARNGISYLQAFIVGIGQAVAVIPGLSRSGTTISTGLLCGVRRDVMAQFSFLMVIIPILGEALLNVVGGDFAQCSVSALPLVLGFISAFVSGLFACKVMIALVKKAKLKWFALYCLVVGVAVILFKAL